MVKTKSTPMTDPKAVYTFFGNRVLEVEPAIKDFKYPSESAFLRKQRKNKDLKPPRPIVLEIGLSDEEFKERRLHHSYGAKGVESPIRGHIHPSRIRFRKEIDKKLLRKKASFEDYHKIAEVRTPKAQMEIAKQLAERPEIGFREIFK